MDVGEVLEQPRDAEQAEEAQQGSVLADPWNEQRRDDHEVEHVPAGAEERLRAPAKREDANHQLGHEDRQEDAIEQVERVTVACHDPVEGLHAEQNGVEADRDDDRSLEALGIGNASEAGGHGTGGGGRGRHNLPDCGMSWSPTGARHYLPSYGRGVGLPMVR